MRIFAFSDWRVQPIEDLYSVVSECADFDLLVYAGDDLNRFITGDTNHFAELTAHTSADTVLVVAGNDDTDQITNAVTDTDSVHNLHQSPFTYDDFVFLGQEGSRAQDPGFTTYTEDEIRTHLHNQADAITDRQPVLVSHIPPYGVLDIGQRFGQQHIGSIAVREFIEAIEPPLTICGHCHQFGGQLEEQAFGSVLNIASHDDDGAPGRYAVITLQPDSLNYTLGSTLELVQSRLTHLVQVGRKRTAHFHDLGITSPEEITDDDREQLTGLPGASTWHADRWIAQAKAIRNDEIVCFDTDAFTELHSDSLILFDIETDLQQQRTWLIGAYSYAADEFIQFFEPDREQRLMNDFLEYVRGHDMPTLIYYGGNHFDERCLKQRFSEHDIDGGAEIFENALDLGLSVQQSLFGPFRRYRLRNVADTLGYEYTHDDVNGFMVGHQYTRYLLDGQEPEWQRFREYNQDDVYALKTVVDVIREKTA